VQVQKGRHPVRRLPLALVSVVSHTMQASSRGIVPVTANGPSIGLT